MGSGSRLIAMAVHAQGDADGREVEMDVLVAWSQRLTNMTIMEMIDAMMGSLRRARTRLAER